MRTVLLPLLILMPTAFQGRPVLSGWLSAIDLNGSLAAAWKQMSAKGVQRIQSGDIESA